MKRFRFKKGIRRLNIPFMLHDFTTWKEQVEQETEKCKKKFGTSKSSEYGYLIENGYAEIYIYKQ